MAFFSPNSSSSSSSESMELDLLSRVGQFPDEDPQARVDCTLTLGLPAQNPAQVVGQVVPANPNPNYSDQVKRTIGGRTGHNMYDVTYGPNNNNNLFPAHPRVPNPQVFLYPQYNVTVYNNPEFRVEVQNNRQFNVALQNTIHNNNTVRNREIELGRSFPCRNQPLQIEPKKFCLHCGTIATPIVAQWSDGQKDSVQRLGHSFQ